MPERQDDFEPIIAPRRSREPRREDDAPPLWRTALAVVAVFAAVTALAWWWMSRSSSDQAVSDEDSESVVAESFPETHVEQEVVPPARDVEKPAEIPQPQVTVPSSDVEVPPAQDVASDADTSREDTQDESVQETAPEPQIESEPAPPVRSVNAFVRFTSPDSQARLELRRASDRMPFLTSAVGETIEVPPGTYRATVSGAGLERFEQEVTFETGQTVEYSVELCAQRQYDRVSLVGRVVEERKCSSTAECETLFAMLGETADDLVRLRDFRVEQCGKWRPGATPSGEWTLNIRCDGAVPETTCRIEIGEGDCMHAQPPRSSRGGACPRAVLK
jgi:hypothetical protein